MESGMIKKYLEDLEERLDPQIEDKLMKEWMDFWGGRNKSDIFSPKRDKKIPARVEWPHTPINSAIEDYNLMVLHQLKLCSDNLAEGNGALLNIRSNYGTCILPSVFGVELFIMEEQFDTLPTNRPLDGGEQKFREIIESGVPDVNNGLGKKVFEMGQKYLELLEGYPKIKKYVNIYHPDLQGPMDVCELLYGSELFLAILDKPDLIKELLELITETYIVFMKKWEQIIPFNNGYSTHWAMLHKGHIMVRDDSAMNLSPEMFDEFIRPYEKVGHCISAAGGIII
jgi:hypothetical protein